MSTTIDNAAYSIYHAARALGLHVECSSSRVSESEYLYVSPADDRSLDNTAKIRISRHDLPWHYNPADYDVGVGTGQKAESRMTGGSARGAISYIARRFGVDASVVLDKMDRASERASKAAATRSARQQQSEDEISAAALDACPAGKRVSYPAARKIVRGIAPDISAAALARIGSGVQFLQRRRVERAEIEAAIAAGTAVASRSASGKTWYLDAAGRREIIDPAGEYSMDAVVAAWRAGR